MKINCRRSYTLSANPRAAILETLESRQLLTASTPFNHLPFAVNASIPAVQYDKGGSGVAYHDTTTANQGLDTYRKPDAVDIQKGGVSGHIIAYAVATEWLDYTVTIPTGGGQYVLDASVANIAAGGIFHLVLGSANLTGAILAPNTGSWYKYATVASSPFSLPGGTVTLRLALDQNASSKAVANFDTFKLVPTKTDPNAINAKVAAILKSVNPEAQTGAYLRVVDGAVLSDVNGEQQFEPASNIKIVLAVTALKAVQAGTASLTEPITYYYDPADPTNQLINPEAIADTPANARTLTLQNAIAGMLQNSDNRMTYALEQRFGLPAINATAASLGMTHTVWTQTVGNLKPGNFMTLADADLLYGKVLDGSALNATYTKLFQTLMLNQTNYGLSRFLPVMHQEAANILGVTVGSAAEIKLTNTFSAAVLWGSKAGTYYLPINAGSYYDVRSHTGYLVLPTRVNGVTQHVSYSYGEFLVNAVVPVTPAGAPTPGLTAIENALLSANQEMVRGIIRSAMLTFA